MTVPSFKGTSDQQTLAAEIFRLMTTQGALFAADAPIKQTLTNLADFLAAQRQRDREVVAQEIDAALRENQQIFTREEADDDVMYITSRLGNYTLRHEDSYHTFKQRLYEPEEPLPIDDISVVVSTSRPALTTVEPVFISDYWQRQAGLTPISPASTERVEAEPAEAADLLASDEMPRMTAPVMGEEEALDVAEAVSDGALVEAATPVGVAPQPVAATATMVITLSSGVRIDLRQPVDALIAANGRELEAALLERLDQDPLRRIVHFGRSIYPEAGVASLGKNDMRRIRDYILERNEPLLDTEIIADLYYHNPRQHDYEGFRFSLNYRLNREKDFEFVGVEGANLWSTKGLPAIGTKRVKTSEMGQITTYLTEGFDDSLEIQSAEAIKETGTANRLLTFFEWEYGILPFDANLAALLPQPFLPEQRSAVLRFESPQQYTSYLAEVRYPTGNRGGWLQGLEDFFREHLVPGALITLARTNDPNVFTITYEEAAQTDDRLLTLDEKKNKFAFVNVSFYCAVDVDQLPNQQRFGRLRNLKSLPMSERRKTDMVLAHVFETVGEPLGRRDEGRYRISLDDLLVACNVLRPISRSYLRFLLEQDEAYTPDPAAKDVYIYQSEPESRDATEEDEAEEEPVMGLGRYDDDDE